MTQEVPVNSRDIFLQASLTRTTNNSLPKEEKPGVINQYNQILADKTILTAQATKYNIVTELNLYTISVTNLTNYLGTLTIPVAWNNTSNTTLLQSRNVFDSMFTTVMQKRIALQLVIDSFIGAEDTTPPPKASGLATTPSFASIIINWNPLADMSKISHTEIWRSSTNSRNEAILIGQAPGFVYVDNIGLSTSFYYWVRFVSTASIKGQFNADIYQGVIGNTGQDSEYIMQLLLNKLGYDQFNVAAGVFPVRTETTLPTLPNAKYPIGVLVTLTTNGKLYRNVGNVWKSDVNASDLTGQITNSQIANSSLDITKFASGIEPVTIVAEVPTIKSTTIVFSTIDSKQYRWNGTSYVASIPTTDLIGQVSSSQIASGAIDSTKFANNIEPTTLVSVVPTSKLTNAVFNTTDRKLYRWNGSAYTASTPTSDLTGQIQANQIQANSITAGQIATDTITSGQIAAGAITASEIAANTITAAQIAANTITASQIATNTITASQIAANTITAGQIAANTITASQIATDTITAGQIATGAITSTEIAAGAITTDKLVVVSKGSALNIDPNFEDQTAWSVFSNVTIATVSDGKSGNKVCRSSSIGQVSVIKTIQFPVVSGKIYRISALLRSVGSVDKIFLRLARYNSLGDTINDNIGLENVSVPLGVWTELSGTITVEETAVNATINLYLKWALGGTSYVEAQNVRCEEVIGSALIQDGAITANKIMAGSVDTNKLAANSVTAGKIAAGSIVAGDGVIANAAIGSAQIINVTADKIDSRGLTIKDAAGTVIFGSGTPLTSAYANIPIGGKNQIPNSGPAPGQLGQFKLLYYEYGSGVPYTFAPSYDPWRPKYSGGVYIVNNGTVNTSSYAFISIVTPNSSTEVQFPVVVGKRYEASAYLSAHRCKGNIGIYFVDSTGNIISAATSSETTVSPSGDLSIWEPYRSHVFATAPANSATVIVRCKLTGTGEAAPYLFASMWYFGEALPAQTTPSPWTDSGASFGGNISGQITQASASTYISNAAINLAQINTASIGQLSALTATIGLLRSRASGGRTEIADDIIRVYNDSNLLKMKLGKLN